jgi:hypothetical protein
MTPATSNLKGVLRCTWLAAIAVGVFPAAGASSKVQMEHVVIHRDDTQYYLGASLCALASGDLLLGMREAHARPPGRQSHVDLTARSVMFRSRDGGRTFGDKRVINDETDFLSPSQDTTLTALADGSLIASVYTWGIAPSANAGAEAKGVSRGAKPYTPAFEGLWTLRSTNEGRSWTPRSPVSLPGLPLAARASVIELPDRSLLMIANDVRREAGKTRPWATAYCLRSTDRGVTWTKRSNIEDGSAHGLHFLEPGWVRLRSGRIIAMLRTRAEIQGAQREQPPAGFLFQSVSDDDGRTWSKPVSTQIYGFPAHLIELRDGRVLCAYGYRRAPFGVRATLSHDAGKTWDSANEIIVRDDGGNSDLGYPVSVQLPDDRVLMIYYFNQEKPNAPETSTRYIAGTFLRL